MKLTENFYLTEFASKDGAAFPDEVNDNLARLAQNLQVLRDHLGKPVIVNSGYRSLAHNERIGGAKNSFHVKGMAADIRVEGLSARMLYSQIEMLIDAGKMDDGGLGLYNTFVHYDIRPIKTRWNYSTN